jgi:hypothetical protein
MEYICTAIFASGNGVQVRTVCATADVAREPIIKIVRKCDMVDGLPE